ncbi:SAMS2 [Symbiodinium sp. CCMP2592]|nr:SAMS2 [Symbiodinium sp. CCMP2592]
MNHEGHHQDQPDLAKLHFSKSYRVSAKVSNGGRVETLLRKARAGRTSLNTIHYNAAISSCKLTGDWKAATNWLRTMAQEMLEIDGCSLHAAISACRGRGNWALAVQLLCSMEQSQVRPVAARFGATLAVCQGHVSWPLAVSIWTAGCTRASDMPTEADLSFLQNGLRYKVSLYQDCSRMISTLLSRMPCCSMAVTIIL